MYLCVHFTERELHLGEKNCHRMIEKESRFQPGARVVGVQVEAKGLQKLTTLHGLTASGPGHLVIPATACPFPRTPPLTLGEGSPGDQMPVLKRAGGLRKCLFILGTQPICLMGEGLVVSIAGPDS